ncbi:MAG TPA: hypothetical protein VIY27_09090, partial [Myxococcota bacterium]
MSYRGIGQVEIDLTGERHTPYGPPLYYHPPPAPVVDMTPSTPGERAAALGVAVLFLGVIAYAVYKAPKTRTVYRERKQRREPSVRIRLNRRRK